jgi:ATP-dependent helicase/nuclease subunit A
MAADSAARARALDTSTSFLVQAPAGSGKTELLIQRYVKLLATVESPEAVIAITFTRKAAGEMRARVLEVLRRAESGAAPAAEHEHTTLQIARKVLDHDRRLGWKLLDNPAQMRIETIDALCASITRRMPWLARFGAMPEITEKAEALYREAARSTLRHADSGHAALASILLHLDNDFNAAERLIVQMLEKRDQWLRHTGATSVRAELEASLQRLVRGRLQELRAAFNSSAAAEIAALFAVDRFPGGQTEDLPRWVEVADLLLTAKGEWRKRADKGPRQDALLARLRSNQTLCDALHLVRRLPSPEFTDSQWQAMQAAVSVLTLAVAELQLVFREHGHVDFAELAIRASDALGRLDSPTDLALALGQRIQHILVDEFQDTSYTQFELLEKLTAGWEPSDGRSMFLVGDPMQSIYRFREADVSLLLKAREEGLGAIRFEALALTSNFRSRPEIVEWVNKSFPQILPSEDDSDLAAVTYSASAAGVAASGGAVQIHAFLDAQAEADRVVELLRNGNGSGTIAILVRARPHLAQIVSALKRNRIPFQAVEIDQLGERPVVEDLMALTFALLHPGDRVSWLAILRAPWCGLTLADLHALAGADPNAAIWDLLHKLDAGVTADGAVRIRRMLPELEHAQAERGRRPLRDWVERVWLRIGGPACTDETGSKDAAAYFDLLEGIQQGADLDDFQWFREQVNLLFAQTDIEADGRLQLMTIHKAKGLEFDTVILPGLGALAGSDEPELLLWLEQRGELLLAPISESGHDPDPIYKYLAHIERRKAEHETGRLLYVAATRARERLHLMGSVKLKNDGSIAEPPAGSFLKLLWPIVSQSFANISRAPVVEPAQERRMIRRVPSTWQVPSPPPALKPSPRRIETLEPQHVAFEWVGDRLRHAGTALHGFLQRIAREGVSTWSEDAVRSRRDLYRSVLANLGVPPDDLAEAVERVETGLLKTLRDPRGRWILEAHAEAECELKVAGLIDGKFTEAMIDRTFVEHDVRWIIDYKTSEHLGADVEAFLNSEQNRYREQLERYARLLFQQDGRPIRLALYFPLLGGWREWPAAVLQHRQATLFEL